MTAWPFDAHTRTRLQDNLNRFDRRAVDPSGLKRAAVALALVPGPDGTPCFVLTRRTGSLRNHGGQFALPGGRVDPGETAEQTARRELSEEVGIELGADTVLGSLDDFATRSGFLITPVVLWGRDVEDLAPNPQEVAVAYRVPIHELYRPEVPLLSYIPESEQPLLSLPLIGTHIYTPTASIIFQLREVAFEGRDTRVHHYEQPVFAWK